MSYKNFIFVFGGEFTSPKQARGARFPPASHLPPPPSPHLTPSQSRKPRPNNPHSQEKFHHYKELWRLDVSTWAWELLPLRGGPSARSGHRMVLFKNKLLVFGGFYDVGRETK